VDATERKVTDNEIDAILDAALDHLDSDDELDQRSAEEIRKEEDSKRSGGKQCPVVPPAQKDVAETRDEESESLNEVMQELLKGKDGEEAFTAVLEHLQSQMSAKARTQGATAKNAEKQPTSSGQERGEKDTSSSTEVDRTISRLLDDMASAPGMNDSDATDEQAMMEDLMKEFEKMNENFNADDVIDGMMEQLLAKELMYEPMKQVTDKFPEWLKTNKGTLAPHEYDQRCNQYECFKQLLHVYDSEPDNTEKLMGLMQNVQEYGQPPPEIVKEIAPGLELDSDGVPKIDGLFGDGEEECRIM